MALGIVVAWVCFCVSVNYELFRTISHHPFKLGSPYLGQGCKTTWLRHLLLTSNLMLNSNIYPHFELVRAITTVHIFVYKFVHVCTPDLFIIKISMIAKYDNHVIYLLRMDNLTPEETLWSLWNKYFELISTKYQNLCVCNIFKLWFHNYLLNMCCRGICKNLLRSDGQQRNYSKAKFPSNLNCGQNSLVEWAPGDENTTTRLIDFTRPMYQLSLPI